MKLKCIAIDDEPLALDKVKGYVDKIDTLDLINTFDNAIDALVYLKENRVDLMFLDVQMDELNGIQMLESLSHRPHVILTTAYDKYTLKGFELNITDYLLKPFSFPRFLQAIDKVFDAVLFERHKMPGHGASAENHIIPDFIFVRADSKYKKVKFSEILFIEGMKDYIRINTEAEKIMTLKSFKTIMGFLPEEQFIRIHKSYIVALSKIDSIERDTLMINDNRIPIGDSYRKHFFYVLKQNQLLL